MNPYEAPPEDGNKYNVDDFWLCVGLCIVIAFVGIAWACQTERLNDTARNLRWEQQRSEYYREAYKRSLEK